MSLLNLGKMQHANERSSNLELLRLVSMLMVINLHSFWGYSHGSGLLQAVDFLRESTSICAVNVFLIISGYFGIKWKIKSLFNLVFQLFFYAFVVYGVAVLTGIVDFSIGGLLKNATCLYMHWTFITYYLLMYLCAPLLNAFVKEVSENKLLGFIVILVISENFLTRDYGFLNYCTMYLIGRYISCSHLVDNKKIKAGLLYVIITFLIFVLVFGTYKVFHINNPSTMESLFWGYSYAAPLVILQAVFLFIWFARLNIQSSVINWGAASCLSIFLIHMHPSIKEVFYKYTEDLYSLPPYEHFFKLVVLMCAVFVGSIIVDKIRIPVSNLAYKVGTYLFSFKKETKEKLSTFIPNNANNQVR